MGMFFAEAGVYAVFVAAVLTAVGCLAYLIVITLRERTVGRLTATGHNEDRKAYGRACRRVDSMQW